MTICNVRIFQFFQMLDKKRETLDLWRMELGWSMVKVVQDDVGKASDNIDAYEKKIETWCQSYLIFFCFRQRG